MPSRRHSSASDSGFRGSGQKVKLTLHAGIVFSLGLLEGIGYREGCTSARDQRCSRPWNELQLCRQRKRPWGAPEVDPKFPTDC